MRVSIDQFDSLFQWQVIRSLTSMTGMLLVLERSQAFKWLLQFLWPITSRSQHRSLSTNTCGIVSYSYSNVKQSLTVVELDLQWAQRQSPLRKACSTSGDHMQTAMNDYLYQTVPIGTIANISGRVSLVLCIVDCNLETPLHYLMAHEHRKNINSHLSGVTSNLNGYRGLNASRKMSASNITTGHWSSHALFKLTRIIPQHFCSLMIEGVIWIRIQEKILKAINDGIDT